MELIIFNSQFLIKIMVIIKIIQIPVQIISLRPFGTKTLKSNVQINTNSQTFYRVEACCVPGMLNNSKVEVLYELGSRNR